MQVAVTRVRDRRDRDAVLRRDALGSPRTSAGSALRGTATSSISTLPWRLERRVERAPDREQPLALRASVETRTAPPRRRISRDAAAASVADADPVGLDQEERCCRPTSHRRLDGLGAEVRGDALERRAVEQLHDGGRRRDAVTRADAAARLADIREQRTDRRDACRAAADAARTVASTITPSVPSDPTISAVRS